MKSFGHKERSFPSTLELGGLLMQSRSSSLFYRATVAGVSLFTYVTLEWVSFIHEYKSVPITPWNPGLGVIFALMVLRGSGYSVVLFAGVIIAETTVLQTSLQWPIILGIAAIFTIVYGTAAAVARNHLRFDVSLYHLRDVVILLAASISSAVLAAFFLSLLLLLDVQLELSDVLVASGPLLVGDLIGMAVMTPLTLRLVSGSHPMPVGPLRALMPELLLYAALIAVSLWVIGGGQTVDGYKFFYLLFLPVVVAAVRYGLDGACVSLAFTQFGLVGIMHLYGFDARAFTEFQMLMLVLSATGLIVGAVVSERQNADRLLQESEGRLKEKEMEAAQAARHNLVSGMASALAHEITQPMTAARALARAVQHILATSAPDLTRATGNLATLITHIDHAGGVISHMRDFLRRGHPHVSTLDVQSMLEDALSLVRAKASAHEVTIDLDVPDMLPPVHADRVQLEQVVLNLVHNAIEAIVAARQANGRIAITAERFDGPARIEISIMDNGPGIPDEFADHLFAPLTTSKSEGLGLGLSICATIVESHGGRVWLHSRQPGATELRFSLPLSASQAK